MIPITNFSKNIVDESIAIINQLSFQRKLIEKGFFRKRLRYSSSWIYGKFNELLYKKFIKEKYSKIQDFINFFYTLDYEIGIAENYGAGELEDAFKVINIF